MVDRASSLHLGDQVVSLVEEENAELLALLESLRQAEIIEDAARRRKRRARFDLAFRQPLGGGFDKL